jgi:hypothetical protein
MSGAIFFRPAGLDNICERSGPLNTSALYSGIRA